MYLSIFQDLEVLHTTKLFEESDGVHFCSGTGTVPHVCAYLQYQRGLGRKFCCNHQCRENLEHSIHKQLEQPITYLARGIFELRHTGSIGVPIEGDEQLGPIRRELDAVDKKVVCCNKAIPAIGGGSRKKTARQRAVQYIYKRRAVCMNEKNLCLGCEGTTGEMLQKTLGQIYTRKYETWACVSVT